MTTLLVCSGGGHLKQLWTLWPRFGIDVEPVWVTFDTGLSRALLRDRDVEVAPYTAPRDLVGGIRIASLADRVLKERKVERVISTGASLAVSFMGPARARGITCHYVESAARADGPSLSGRLVQRLPGVNLYSQYPTWAGGRWHFSGSLYDGYRPGPTRVIDPAGRLRVVVTLGTTESYGFRRALERLVAILPPDADVLWQTGATDVAGLPIAAHATVPADDLASAVSSADVVVAHSGTGSAITAMDAGKCAVLLPRRRTYREHVDDHQTQIADELDRRGLAIRCEVEDLTADTLRRARERSVETVSNPEAFRLLRDPIS